MKQLWAPWRVEYILGEKEEGCIFCTAPERDPDEALLIYNGGLTTVILNKYPYNNGHLLISPKRHVAELEELTPQEGADLFRLLAHSVKSLKEALSPHGFNIGMNIGRGAGAGIPGHLHIHVVPRWQEDVNFMPVLADTKVIPEHLQKTLERLRPLFKDLQPA